jgi:hypothetical protein
MAERVKVYSPNQHPQVLSSKLSIKTRELHRAYAARAYRKRDASAFAWQVPNAKTPGNFAWREE